MEPKILHHQVQPYGHCATICRHQKGVFLAFYRGPECTDAQAVVIQYCEDNKIKASINLHRKTGNCVLWAINKNETGLIYSYFNDTDGINVPTRAVHRWMYCSNWMIKLSYSSGKIISTMPQLLSTQPLVGFLVRCQPIKVASEWLLPIYHEKTCYGLTLRSSNGKDWRTAGPIGMDSRNGKLTDGYLIQPTFWYSNKKLYSLSRDTSGISAWYSTSTDLGDTWTKPIKTQVSNTNNSLVALHDNTESPWLVWNLGCGRKMLALGKWNPKELSATPYLLLNRSTNASYPNYTIDANGLIHIVHSDTGPIAHHIIDPEYLETLKPADTILPRIS